MKLLVILFLKKTIRNEFECFDVKPLRCNFCFFLHQKNNKSCNALFLLMSCLKLYNNKFSHALLFWYKYMHRNYCFRRKQHFYGTCDTALAASMEYIFRLKIYTKILKKYSILYDVLRAITILSLKRKIFFSHRNNKQAEDFFFHSKKILN